MEENQSNQNNNQTKNENSQTFKSAGPTVTEASYRGFSNSEKKQKIRRQRIW